MVVPVSVAALVQARLVAQAEHDTLKGMARSVGMSDEQFRTIVRDVEDMAVASATWGAIKERDGEIRRRIARGG